MGKRGLLPVNKISLEWSNDLAYAVGLLVTDGCLYNDGRHMSLTTTDMEQALNFKKCLGLDVKIGIKRPKSKTTKECYHVQFGNIIFYQFLISIGLMPAKSKVLKEIMIPHKYFPDYIRGCFDGDGCFYSYWDSRWRSSHMFYVVFSSASKEYTEWLQSSINELIGVSGHTSQDSKKSTYQLRYAKREALEIINKMYYNPSVTCLSRKRSKIEKALETEQEQQKMYS